MFFTQYIIYRNRYEGDKIHTHNDSLLAMHEVFTSMLLQFEVMRGDHHQVNITHGVSETTETFALICTYKLFKL
jgi:hypothetical protein